jgi:hypothetical protein
MKPRGNYDDTLCLRIPVSLREDIRSLGADRQMDLNEMVVEALRYYQQQSRLRQEELLQSSSQELSRT